MRKLPIGIQDFEKLRTEDFVYVDKTEYVYRLAETGIPCFLSRPRRFGKSLFLSTLRAYFEGKRELFKGLRIEELEGDDEDAFVEYPVFYFDLVSGSYMEKGDLEEVLDRHLCDWEEIYGRDDRKKTLAGRFQHLLKAAKEKTGRNCVVLVDEYDKPLLDTMADKDLNEYNRAVFKGFFSTLKSYDGYLRFVFITGVTRFSKVSIFSDLNQLRDISMINDYAGICGITESEIHDCFMPEIMDMAKKKGMTEKECLNGLKRMYDGYHFSQEGEDVYNPYSLLNALLDKRLGSYWFSTGTPTFLIEKLRATGFDAKDFTEKEVWAGEEKISDYRADDTDLIPLFYQTGYLTIKKAQEKKGGHIRYLLGYPNDEVKYGFLNSLAPVYLHETGSDVGLDIFAIDDILSEGDTDALKDVFTALFARLPYYEGKEDIDKWAERDFQNVIYIVFMLLGEIVKVQQHSSNGRADCIVETGDYVYIFEFKRDKSAREAMQQIEDKGYDKPYTADKRRVIKIGASFCSSDRALDGWIVSK